MGRSVIAAFQPSLIVSISIVVPLTEKTPITVVVVMGVEAGNDLNVTSMFLAGSYGVRR